MSNWCGLIYLRKAEKELGRFEIQIHSREHHTWQGELKADGFTFSFESELELLQKMGALLAGPAFSESTGGSEWESKGLREKGGDT